MAHAPADAFCHSTCSSIRINHAASIRSVRGRICESRPLPLDALVDGDLPITVHADDLYAEALRWPGVHGVAGDARLSAWTAQLISPAGQLS